MTFSRFISHLHTGDVLISQVNYRKQQRQKSCRESRGGDGGNLGGFLPKSGGLGREGLLSVTEDIGDLLVNKWEENQTS